MSRWRPALRMARRDLRRHKVRAVLTCLLVALPVVVATVAALGTYNSRWDREQQARAELGSADALVEVTPYAAVRPRAALDHVARPATFEVVDGERRPVRRSRADVDVASLLPSGSTVAPRYSSRSVPLATGGSASVHFVDLGVRVNASFVELVAGRAPSGPDEVAVTEVVADELGMLDDGEPADDAALTLADGTRLPVVGVVDPSEYVDGGLFVVASTESELRGDRRQAGWLVDLPPMSRSELKEVAATASAAGVLFRPRDSILHPRAWRLPAYDDFDATAVVAGALAVLVGLLEVVLLVGAAFAVAARRQVRDLGLLSANGGAAPDLRRVLLAQGAVLGVVSSLVGVLVGIAAFRGLVPLWERIFGQEMWRQELDWWALAVVFLLGSLTSVVAAVLPAWNVSRLTPVAALSGRFPIRPGEARAHRGAFVLAATGLLLLLVGGWATARTFGPGGREESLAPAAAGLGLVLLLAGTVWATPYVVRRVAAAGGTLSLSGRYAFRDAARHRFRSAGAVMALMVTVAGAVLAGFGFASVARAVEDRGYQPANSLEVPGDRSMRPGQLQRMQETIESVVGPVELEHSAGLSVKGAPGGFVRVGGRHGDDLEAVDEGTLHHLRVAEPSVLEAFRNGAVVLVGRRADRALDAAGFVQARLAGTNKDVNWRLPAVGVEASREAPGQPGQVDGAFVSHERAAELGMVPTWSELLFRTGAPVTDGQLDRLEVYGVSAWSEDPDRLLTQRMQFAGLGVAGLLSLLVVGVAVAMAAAESRDDVATLAAVGAGPWRRRSMGAMHGLFLGLVGAALGAAVGVPAGAALTQLDGMPGIDVPWLATAGTMLVVLLAAPVAGWVVTPSRLALTRRTA